MAKRKAAASARKARKGAKTSSKRTDARKRPRQRRAKKARARRRRPSAAKGRCRKPAREESRAPAKAGRRATGEAAEPARRRPQSGRLAQKAPLAEGRRRRKAATESDSRRCAQGAGTRPGSPNASRRRHRPDPAVLARPRPDGIGRADRPRPRCAQRLDEHTETSPALTAGDVDADWDVGRSVGDEAPGGDNPTPDQDVVDDIGKALGVAVRGQRGTERRGQDRQARQAPLGARPGVVRGLTKSGDS